MADAQVVEPRAKKKPRQDSTPIPNWAASCQRAKIVSDLICKDLNNCGEKCGRINVRLHVAVSASSINFDGAIATARISVLPLPGKPFVLRSQPSTSETEGDGGFTYFDFSRKAGILSLSFGDLRSKIFRDGACPRVHVEFSVAGSTWTGDAYLPAIANLQKELVLVILQSQDLGSEVGGEKDKESTISFMMEVNPVGDTDSQAVFLPDHWRNLLASHRKGSATSPVFRISTELDGILGKGLKPLSNLLIEASLRASGTKEVMSLAESSSFGTGVTIDSSFSVMKSKWCLGDLLELKLCRGPHPQDEIGRIMIPLAALVSSEGNSISSESYMYQCIMPNGGETSGTGSVDGAAAGRSNAFKLGDQSIVLRVVEVPSPDDDASESSAPVEPMTESFPDEEGGVDEIQASQNAAAVPQKKTFPQISKSINGQFLACCQGFIATERAKDMTTRNLLKSYVSADACMRPEDTQHGMTEARVLGAVEASGFVASVEWGKSFSCSVVTSLQQVRAL